VPFSLMRPKIAGFRSPVLLSLALFSLFLSENCTFASEDPPCFEQLIEELEHPDSDRRWDAVNALGASGDKRAVPPPMRALEKDMKQRKGITMAIIPSPWPSEGRAGGSVACQGAQQSG
jgi:hypothetical protein